MKRRKIFKKLALVLAGLGLLLAAGVALLVGSGLNDRLERADAALVLGNKVEPNGEPSPRLKARLDRAVVLYREGYFPLIIVSGAVGVEGVPEGTAMKKYLVAQGVPVSAIVVDDRGVDTWASALNTREILKATRLKSVLVITQYFHVPRSRLALEKAGVAPVYSAHAFYFEGRDVYSILRELPAVVKYWRLPAAQTD